MQHSEHVCCIFCILGRGVGCGWGGGGVAEGLWFDGHGQLWEKWLERKEVEKWEEFKSYCGRFVSTVEGPVCNASK